MLSVLLLGFDALAREPSNPETLVRTLASLVPATVDGIVRDLCLAGPAEARPSRSGRPCGLRIRRRTASFAAAVRKGAHQLRCAHVLVIRPGITIGRPVIEELASLLPTLRPRGAAFAC